MHHRHGYDIRMRDTNGYDECIIRLLLCRIELRARDAAAAANENEMSKISIFNYCWFRKFHLVVPLCP
jgi:hypothetical protein